MKSEIIFQRPCEEASPDDLVVAQDLLDTLAANADTCVGMAANMIGVRKRVIAFVDAGERRAMLNPVIVQAQGPYQEEEGCLSLVGKRQATRYKRIKVRYTGMDLKERTEQFSGWTAQIIQHEVDHCNGIVI
jgi:peptide deformylase